MGIRIHKVLGYGLTDVATEDGAVVDPRINTQSPLLDWERKPTEDYRDFVDRLAAGGDEDAQLEAALFTMAEPEGGGAGNLCTWNGEYGLPNVLVVRPVGFPGWSRTDDVIDYEEETLLHPGCEPRIGSLKGIYPFNGLYMNARTGARCEATLARTWHRFDRIDSAASAGIVGRLAERLGFHDAEDARRNLVPVVPGEVRRACEWGNLFTRPDVWRQLRPMLYVYWA